MQPSEYQHVKEMVVQVLSDYEDGISVDRLTKKVSELMSPDTVSRYSELWAYVKRAQLDLEGSGLIERIPNADPVEVRLLCTGREAVMDAARRGHSAVLTRLLGEGVDQEAKNAALISAVINNRVEIVRMLLDAGADVHAKDSMFGKYALMYVTARTSKQIVQLLQAASNKGAGRMLE
jgi:hypothetical protein